MDNRVRIKRRGKLKYYATEIPQQFRELGEGRKEVMAATREALAEKYEREISRRKKGLDREAGKASVEEFLVDKFLPFYKHEVEPQTFYDYLMFSDMYIVPLLGKVSLIRLSPRDVDQFVAALRRKISDRTKKPLSERTIEYIYAVLRRSLQFAVDWQYIAFNPASARVRAARRRRKGRISQVRFLTPEQARKLLAAVQDDRMGALYLLALTTGMREGELFGLHWSDVDEKRMRLTVNHSLAHTKRKKGEEGARLVLKGPKNAGSRRTIDLPEIAVEALKQHAARQAELKWLAGEGWIDEGYVFTSRIGKPLDRGNALHRFQRILKENELPKIRFYDLRHTHASLLISEGVHAKKIAERLGHASIKLTMDLYGHLFEGSDHESAARMDRLFKPGTEDGSLCAQNGDDPSVLKRNADKNADKTLSGENRVAVTA